MDKDKKHNVSLGTLYDFNKQIMLKEERINKFQISLTKEELVNWLTNKKNIMLLCRERYDFTIFLLKNNIKKIVDELFEVLNNRGNLLSIEKDSNTLNDAWEIWIEIDNEAFAYYLFDCSDWIIEG